jgi:tetratricopeptide (TPR) repeat protein
MPALEAFDTALETDMAPATKSHALYRKGLLLRMMSRAEESIEVLKESLALADTMEREVETLTALGDSYNMLGNAEEAMKYLNQSIYRDSSNFEGYYNLVNIMKERGNSTQTSEWEALYGALTGQLKTYMKQKKQNRSPGKVVSAYWALFIMGEKLSMSCLSVCLSVCLSLCSSPLKCHITISSVNDIILSFPHRYISQHHSCHREV